MVSLPTRFGAHHERTIPLSVAPMTRTLQFFGPDGLPSDHRFIDCARSLKHDCHRRESSLRAHAQPVSGLHLVERDVAFRGILAH